MNRIFILLIIMIINACSEKQEPLLPVIKNKNKVVTYRNLQVINNRHKEYGKDVWPGKILTGN